MPNGLAFRKEYTSRVDASGTYYDVRIGNIWLSLTEHDSPNNIEVLLAREGQPSIGNILGVRDELVRLAADNPHHTFLFGAANSKLLGMLDRLGAIRPVDTRYGGMIALRIDRLMLR